MVLHQFYGRIYDWETLTAHAGTALVAIDDRDASIRWTLTTRNYGKQVGSLAAMSDSNSITENSEC
jgi:hypothetical protein